VYVWPNSSAIFLSTIIIPTEIAARIAEVGIQTVEALGNESDTTEA
jgi:hypothetical protein